MSEPSKSTESKNGKQKQLSSRLTRTVPPAHVEGHTVDPNVLISGYGAFKGHITLSNDVDWTAPIYAQVLARNKRANTPKKTKRSRAA
jgi:hypothetical protein